MKVNFTRMMRQMARSHGSLEALVNVERGRRYTFDDLHLLTNRIVNMMRGKLGLVRGTSYLCLLENDNLSLLHAWTILKGDAAAVLTNLHDTYDEHLWQLDWVGPKVAFLEAGLVDKYYDAMRARGVTIISMDPLPEPRDGVEHFWDLLDGVSDADPDVENDAHADVLIYRFTGGTTGRGKCAQYTTDIWLGCRDAFYIEDENPFREGARSLQIAPLSHGAALTVLPLMGRGGCLVTHNQPDLVAWCRTVERERITTATLVPTMLYRLLELDEAAQFDLSSLGFIYYGAAPMSPAKLAQLQARFGNIFIQVYGATECFQSISTLARAQHLPEPDGSMPHLSSAGRVSAAVEVRIVDDDGNDLPDGETGEVWMRARTTIPGYYKNPEGTASEFEDGFWKSGDLGYRDGEGFLFIVDRKKDMIITGGFNVYAIEVEGALDSHPDVTMSAVVGVPHPEWGEAIHAEVVVAKGSSLSERELIEYARTKLSRHKAPKTVSFVEALPLSAAHKVLRRVVREKYWKGQASRVA
jgi:fatty-acyl-CoA synthase